MANIKINEIKNTVTNEIIELRAMPLTTVQKVSPLLKPYVKW
jgi:hypothetical protein